MEKAVIYARYSSNAQREVSIDQQLHACRDFAARQGLDVVDVYEDRALTGTSDKRPGFQRMIADAEGSDWAYVIVYALDRFARDRYDSAVYKRKLKDAGVRVLSAMENLTEDPTGILLESLLEGMAEYYSRELAQKVHRGMEDNAHRCMVNGPIPPGYERGADGKYAVNDAEAAVIQELFRRVAERERIIDILSDFEERMLHRKNGKKWTRAVADRALVNERYTGTYIYGEIRIEGGIPAIVDQELFYEVQSVIGNKKNPRRAAGVPQRRRRENGIYLLTGKLYCGDCKSPMVGVSGRGKSGNPYYYYACQNQRAHSGCDQRPVRRDQIEYAITSMLQKNILSDENIQIIADTIIADRNQSDEGLTLQNMEARLQDVKKSLKNLLRAIENGIFSETTQSRLTSLEEEQRELTAKIGSIRKQQDRLPTKEQMILMLKMFQSGDPKDKDFQQTIIDAFLVRAYLYSDNIKIVFHVREGETEESEIPLDFDVDSIFKNEENCSYNGRNGSPEKTAILWMAVFLFIHMGARLTAHQSNLI